MNMFNIVIIFLLIGNWQFFQREADVDYYIIEYCIYISCIQIIELEDHQLNINRHLCIAKKSMRKC